MTTPKTPVSPKVATATGGSAAGIVLAYVLGQLPFIASLPPEVQAALFTLLVAAVTYGAGYLKRDPLRG